MSHALRVYKSILIEIPNLYYYHLTFLTKLLSTACFVFENLGWCNTFYSWRHWQPIREQEWLKSTNHRLVQHLKVSFQSGFVEIQLRSRAKEPKGSREKKQPDVLYSMYLNVLYFLGVPHCTVATRYVLGGYIDQWICVVFRRKYTPNWESTLSGVFKIGAVFVVQLVLHGCVQTETRFNPLLLPYVIVSTPHMSP